mgnify:FL=1
MKRIVTLLLVSIFLTLAACTPKATPQPPLRVAVLPVLDVLPLYVAQQQGYFTEAGVQVELVPVGSAPERDQLMQSGQIDGMLNELVTTLYYNRDSSRVKIVRFARIATQEYPVFRILAAKDSGITSVEGLKGVAIGISNGTIIEYMADRVLTHAGLTPAEIQKIAVPKIADRTALLESGELKAAVMPDPLASLLLQKGATLVIDDTSLPEVSNSVFTFSVQTLTSRPADVQAFLAAVEKAVLDINADKAKYKDLMVELKLVPPSVVGDYQVPTFPTASVPSQAQFDDALAWAMEKDLIPAAQSYSATVDASFLPKP